MVVREWYLDDIIPFGKYKGKTFSWINSNDSGYLRWLGNTDDNKIHYRKKPEPVVKSMEEELKEAKELAASLFSNIQTDPFGRDYRFMNNYVRITIFGDPTPEDFKVEGDEFQGFKFNFRRKFNNL